MRPAADIKDLDELRSRLGAVRDRLEPAFATDTAAPGFNGTTRSTGHCAAVSLILDQALGAESVSATVEGMSHWFNRVRVGSKVFDVDVTGDQFGYPIIRIAEAERLYDNSRVRPLDDANSETVARARLLAERAGLTSIAESLRGLERAKSSGRGT